jgi:hypothetical protein
LIYQEKEFHDIVIVPGASASEGGKRGRVAIATWKTPFKPVVFAMTNNFVRQFAEINFLAAFIRSATTARRRNPCL